MAQWRNVVSVLVTTLEQIADTTSQNVLHLLDTVGASLRRQAKQVL